MNTREMRIDLLKMGLAAKSAGAHLGGSLSLVEVMAALYGGVMRFDPANPQAENRDRLIFSKGHGVMAQYVALKQVGVLTEEELLTYKTTGSVVSAHPSIHQARLGIDFASGSLGQGLSQGVGVALALRRKQNELVRVFVILGDGECDEGSVWEAAAAAAHYRLNNLIAIIDQNQLQYDGPTAQVLDLSDMTAKWRAFGWEVISVDGHDVEAVGIQKLKEWQIVNVVDDPRAERAAEDRENQRRGHRAHDILSDMHAAHEKRLPVVLRIGRMELRHGRRDVHRDVEHRAEARKEDARKKQSADVDVRILRDEEQRFDVRDIVARKMRGLPEELG